MSLRQLKLGLAVALALVPALSYAQQTAGVFVDANGVLHKRVVADPTGAVARQRIADARARLPADLQRQSDSRKVSLNRLEAELAKRLEAGLGPSDAMQHLAGLTRLEYVFFYPDSGDIVIAGPAEAWAQDPAGRTRGMQTGRPVLDLEDLAVALRAHPPGGQRGPVIGCSIDPTSEGLARMQSFLRQLGGRATPRDTQFIVNGLRTSMGLQTITLLGISPATHFAQVMVEADYRMKLIGIGLERPPVKLASYVDRANPSQVSRNALQRWYFTPNYQSLQVSDDKLAMHLVGEGVKLVNESELVDANGRRISTGTANRASQLFTGGFTSKYPQIAAKVPVYAQLRNLVDLAIATAFIQQQDYFGQAGWKADVLRDETKFAVETHEVPKQVATVVTSVWKGNRLMTPVGGGVNIDAAQALLSENVLTDEEGKVDTARKAVKVKLEAGQWWWD